MWAMASGCFIFETENNFLVFVKVSLILAQLRVCIIYFGITKTEDDANRPFCLNISIYNDSLIDF